MHYGLYLLALSTAGAAGLFHGLAADARLDGDRGSAIVFDSISWAMAALALLVATR